MRSFEWTPPDALTYTWAEAYAQMWNLQIPHTAIYTNLVKFGDGFNADGTPKSKATGMIDSHLPVGRRFGDKINRRSVLYYNITAWISSQSQYPEAAYLFMQWLSSTRTYTWMAGNPGGYFDPFQQANFKEPLVSWTYHPYSMETIPATIARSVPSINFAGQTALDNALDEEIQAAITGQKTAREAMDAAPKQMGADYQTAATQRYRGRHQGKSRNMADNRRRRISSGPNLRDPDADLGPEQKHSKNIRGWARENVTGRNGAEMLLCSFGQRSGSLPTSVDGHDGLQTTS